VRVYTRDTVTWSLLNWEARALLLFLIRKADRSGVIDTNGHGKRGIAVLVLMPYEVVSVAVDALISESILEVHPNGFVLPKFIEAQESPASDAQRQREARERRRVTHRDDTVTKRDEPITKRDDTVTNGHGVSRNVTPILTKPNQTKPNHEENAVANAPASKAIRPKKATKGKEASRPAEGFIEVRDMYIAGFKAKFGDAPEFGARQGSILSKMLQDHGKETVMRKIGIAFTSPPDWPSTPWSLTQIKTQWDSLVARNNSKHVGYTTITGDESYGQNGEVDL
jgi:hypothetical protein